MPAIRRLALITAALVASVTSTAFTEAPEPPPSSCTQYLSACVMILGAPAVMEVNFPAPVPEPALVAPEQIPVPPPQSAQPLVSTVGPTYAGVVAALHSMTAEQLIRFLWPPGAADRMVAIAKRESGLRCDAKNPRSSATGLFQTLSIHRARAERMGLRWSDVAGPDCVADAFLAYAIWKDSGFAPWRL